MQEQNDTAGHLAWLQTQLSSAEGSPGTRVWITGNIAPGSSQCNSRWAKRYNALIERYQAVVTMQLFGGDEQDYFQLQNPT